MTNDRECAYCGSPMAEGEETCSRCDEWDEPTRDISTAGLTLASEPSSLPGSRTAERAQAAARPSDAWTGPLAQPSTYADSRYEMLDTLGRGGMGIVYKVRDLELDEIIALKVLVASKQLTQQAIDRFRAELKIARRINHPNVARLYDIFPWRGDLAISQEYIEGEDLETIAAAGPLPPERLLSYLRYICSALETAHDLGVVHRDLKPSNVRIDLHDRPRILDFGIAALVTTLEGDTEAPVLGTPSYMAPEQALTPHLVDHRTDIYGLGVMLFELATGQLPFAGGTASSIIGQHLHAEPPRPHLVNPGIPIELSDVILRCLAKEPERRCQSAGEVFEQANKGHARRAARGAVPSAHVDGGRGRVLVVDDEDTSRMMLSAMLKKLNTVCLEAADGYAGVEVAIREQPDLIILDIMMPVLDGREALRILKSNSATSSIPVIILSALDDSEEQLQAREMGAAVFLNKPVKGEILELLLERYFG